MKSEEFAAAMRSENHLTLFELNRLVKEVIEYEMPNEYWVEAELSECRETRGHCYMELIQKDPQTATPIARASAKCWASKWMLVRPYFERTTGQRLSAGMKVLLKVYPQFHEAFGFSWIVTDIDPTYTLGDMAKKRQEIIRQLKEEGVFDLQKGLELPLFCQNIAVISSENAAGYGDFCSQLAGNPHGFKFRTHLFPAIMQGEEVEQSIIAALNRIYTSQGDRHSVRSDNLTACLSPCEAFDCVVIIRGGGATSDMSGFDTLALAENVANFPLPIITGIGHDRDESILDMVSHTRVKTPTAAAEFLIDHLERVLNALNNSQEQLARLAQQKLTYYKSQFTAIAELLPRLFSNVKVRQEARLDIIYNRLIHSSSSKLSTLNSTLSTLESRLPIVLERRMLKEQHRLQLIEEKAKSLDPSLLLKRGYSITLKDGKAIRDAGELQSGDTIETRLANGTVVSEIKNKK